MVAANAVHDDAVEKEDRKECIECGERKSLNNFFKNAK